jgi:hypothetical protein
MQIVLNIEESNSHKVLSILKKLGSDLISSFEIQPTKGQNAFAQDKLELTQVLDDIDHHKATLLSHDETWSQIQSKKPY